MIKLMNLLKENSQGIYEYGCIMLYFNFPELGKIQEHIDEEDVYEDPEDPSYGLEDEPHITLLYGLHDDVTLEQINKIINNFTFSTIEIFNPSLFENEDYDVLKFEADDEILNNVNKKLKTLPFTSKFNDYQAHMTIGYIKPGMGKKYVNKFKDLRFAINPSYVVYSYPSDGEKQKEIIQINID